MLLRFRPRLVQQQQQEEQIRSWQFECSHPASTYSTRAQQTNWQDFLIPGLLGKFDDRKETQIKRLEDFGANDMVEKELSPKFGPNWQLCSASAVKVDRPWAAAAYAAAKFKISDTQRWIKLLRMFLCLLGLQPTTVSCQESWPKLPEAKFFPQTGVSIIISKN